MATATAQMKTKMEMETIMMMMAVAMKRLMQWTRRAQWCSRARAIVLVEGCLSCAIIGSGPREWVRCAWGHLLVELGTREECELMTICARL